MAENATPITGTSAATIHITHPQPNGNHIESAEWLKALSKLRLANGETETQVQTQQDIYSFYLKHKIKMYSEPAIAGNNSTAPSLANLHERMSLFLEKSLFKLQHHNKMESRPISDHYLQPSDQLPELPAPAVIKRKNKWLLDDGKQSKKSRDLPFTPRTKRLTGMKHAGKVYKKAKANLSKQLSKLLLRIHAEKGEEEQKDSDSEDIKEKDAERLDVYLAPYWKVEYLQDISQISQQTFLLDRMQADPETYQRVFSTSQLEQSLEEINGITRTLKPMEYYENQLTYMRSEKIEDKKDDKGFVGLFERLEEEPCSANTTLIEEILYDAVGLKRNLKRDRHSTKKKNEIVAEEGAEVSLANIKKVVGILPEDIEKIRKYQIRPWKLPKFSDKFDKVDAVSALFSAGGIERFRSSIKDSTYLSEQNLVLLDRLSVARGNKKPNALLMNPEEREAAMKEREEKRMKYKQMPQAQKEGIEKAMINKQWLWVARKEVPKMHKIYLKYKSEIESNAKRVAIQCMKEVRKKATKCHKLEKEALLRAKRVHRDVLVYWRKKEKEIVEMKRKREKIEKDIKKKEEEQREALLMKKRLEFLIRQSDVYAKFMAKKLGIAEEEKKEEKQENQQDEKVEVDEGLVKKKVQDMINTHLESLKAFDQETQALRIENGGPAGIVSQVQEVQEEDLDNAVKNKFDNSDAEFSRIIDPPKMLGGALKAYQLKGLRWLDNLHEQAINGILADEMGLGKTIQAIAFLAHLAENKGNWGPFLIVAPSSTLYNWQQEFKKFCPSLRVLPYWGALAERKTLRKFFNSKQLYTPSSPFHVLVTSYQLVVADEKSFHRIIWQYMILDEAQAIKNINSQRWKILLGFNCRNRLLMSGTPIQNSMAELWALLHFIMPKLFDNHEQFQEWFSKDIEANSVNEKELNSKQLSRLHAVLKPFMLRRVKKDVEHEIGPKEEVEIFCDMTSRQKLLYQGIKNHLSNITDLFSLVDSKQKMENLMNIVMQLRKVCNHPELFERRMGKIPYLFTAFAPPKPLYTEFNQMPSLTYTVSNPISYHLPKMLFDELFNIHSSIRDSENQSYELYSKNVIDFLSPMNIYERSFKNSCFSPLLFLGFSFSELSLLLRANELLAFICLMHYQERVNNLAAYNENSKIFACDGEPLPKATRNMPLLIVRKQLSPVLYKSFDFSHRPLIYETPVQLKNATRYYTSRVKFYVPSTTTVPIELNCSCRRFCIYYANTFSSDILRHIFLGNSLMLPLNPAKGKSKFINTTLLPNYNPDNSYERSIYGYELFVKGLLPDLFHGLEGSAEMEIPKFNKLVSDCAKLRVLDDLLKKLKDEGHRCLIFCQMTKMLDILEDYLSWKKYHYFRMDGSSSIADRRDMVREFQTNPNIFCFLLSTRAGGLGVTLTAADTVLFYDNDWNPTMDAQATDRAHRIGQTKKVTIYRLITKGTVEERIVKRARQKQNVQATVYSGGAFKADVFKEKEVLDLLYDEDERKKHQLAQKAKLAKKKSEDLQVESMEEPAEADKKPVEPKPLFAIQTVKNKEHSPPSRNGHKEGEEKSSDSGDDSDFKFEVNAEIYDT